MEFNAPVHGTWNIVHTGMLVPEARQIYVCPENCMRGVVMTAAEMNASDRFSFVIVEERDLICGSLEDVTIEGVTDVLNRLEEKPKAVLLFTVCIHHFVGCDLNRIYRELGERFPEIIFVRCYMDPVMQKNGLTPDQKLRSAMYDPLPVRPEDKSSVTLLGSDMPLDDTSDIKVLLKENGLTLREITTCTTWEEYLALGESALFIACYPPALYGAQKQAARLDRKFLYLPACFGYEEIRKDLSRFCQALHIKEPDTGAMEQQCEKALARAGRLIGDTPISIDYTLHPRPLGLARLLLEHGFQVKSVYLDSVSGEEEEDDQWLKKYAPDLTYLPTIDPKMRLTPRESDRPILALGQKAAWFTGSRHFVNMVEGGGLYGYDGIIKMAGLMEEAFLEEKDTEKLVVQKGWGCECCL